jgi:hypothetical protein
MNKDYWFPAILDNIAQGIKMGQADGFLSES